MRSNTDPAVDDVVGAYRDLVKAAEIQLSQALEDLLSQQHLPAEQLLEVLTALNTVERHLQNLREHLWRLASAKSTEH